MITSKKSKYLKMFNSLNKINAKGYVKAFVWLGLSALLY